MRGKVPGRCYGVGGAGPALFINGIAQPDTALWQLQERLERRIAARPLGKAVGSLDPLHGTVNWGPGPGL